MWRKFVERMKPRAPKDAKGDDELHLTILAIAVIGVSLPYLLISP